MNLCFKKQKKQEIKHNVLKYLRSNFLIKSDNWETFF